MASRIQGITVEIGGDTTKLTTALKGVNSEIRNTQSQLRDVEKLLKLDPGNTELLSQKQRMLNEEVQATKEKLEALKRASEQANAALEQGTITQSQYDGLQREIIATEQALEDLEKQAEQSAVALQKISVTGAKLQDVGSKVEGVGKSLLPVSAAVTGIGVAGLKVATDFEKAMSGVQAITGATGAEFEKLRETAIDLGATTAFSSGEVAEAMTEMAKAGWSTTQIIDGMAGVLDATAASGESLATVSTIVADAITGFGLSAKDSARVADLMTQAANSGTIGVSDLGESYKYVAPLAQPIGLSIEDVTTALSAMSMAGIKGSQAGTSLRTVLANMAKPSDTVANAMEDLGIEIANADGSFKSLDEIITIMRTSFNGLTDDQKAYYATALAGKEGMSGLISLLNLTQEEYDALTASMNNCTGVAGETAEVMQDNLQSKVEQLGGALESLAIKLSEYVIPFLTGLVEKITAAVDAFTNMNPIVHKAVLVIGGIFAVGVPACIQNLLNVVGMTILNNKMASYGADPVAAMGIVQKINMIPLQIILGASQGIMPLVSYNYASRNYNRMKEAYFFAIKIALVFAFAIVVLYYAGAGVITGLFIDTQSVIDIGTKLLRGFCIGMPFLCLDFITIGVFQSVGMGKQALFFAIARKVLLEIPAIFIMDKIYPLYGLAYTQVIAEFVLAIVAIVVMVRLFRRLNKSEE